MEDALMSTDGATSAHGKRGTKWFWALAIVITACAGVWLWQYIAFPNTAQCRKMIQTADRVEVRAFIINNEDKGTDFLVLTDPDDLASLAESFRITGIWTPLDYLIGNSYRVRIVGKEATTDIIIRGWGGIESGMWSASIDSKRFFDAIRALVKKQGGQMPDWRKMMSHQSATSSAPSTRQFGTP